jgi:hypothetical protein
MKTVLMSHLRGIFLAVGMCFCAQAFAALGGFPMTGASHRVTATSMMAAKAATSASTTTTSTTTASSAYTENVVTLDSGTVVHEFVATATNLVFKVTWSGPRLPNFQDILGSYSARYLTPSATSNVKLRGLGHSGLSASDLVVQSFGRLGHFYGYAYLSSAVPAGVDLSQLQ